MNKKIDISLAKENIVSKNIYESFDCRFMGRVNTFEYNVNGEKGKKSIVADMDTCRKRRRSAGGRAVDARIAQG